MRLLKAFEKRNGFYVACVINEDGQMNTKQIEKKMVNFMTKYGNAESRQFPIIESFITENAIQKFSKSIKADSWFLNIQVDKSTFNQVEQGGIDGFMDKMFNGSLKKSANGPMLKEDGEIIQIQKGSDNMNFLELVEEFLGESLEKSDVTEEDIAQALETFKSYEDFPEDINKAIRSLLVWAAKVEKGGAGEPDDYPSISLPALPQKLSKEDEDEALIEKLFNSKQEDPWPSVSLPVPQRLIEKLEKRLEEEEEEGDE